MLLQLLEVLLISPILDDVDNKHKADWDEKGSIWRQYDEHMHVEVLFLIDQVQTVDKIGCNAAHVCYEEENELPCVEIALELKLNILDQVKLLSEQTIQGEVDNEHEAIETHTDPNLHIMVSICMIKRQECK